MVFESLISSLGNGTLLIILKIIIALAITSIIAKIIGKIMGHSFKKMSKDLKMDQTHFIVLQRIVVFVIYIIGIFIAVSMIPGLSGVGVSILASAGVLAIVIGFAAQETFANIISGIFIAIFRPFSVGDRLTIKKKYGTVEDITLRHTVIRTWKNERVIIPNSKINEEYITNYSIMDPKILGLVEIGISYDSDIDLARKIMLEEVRKHPKLLKEVEKQDGTPMEKDEITKVRVISLGDFAVTMRLYYWAKDRPDSVKMRFDLTESIKKRFDKEGVEIPFPYHTLVRKKDLPKPRHKSIKRKPSKRKRKTRKK